MGAGTPTAPLSVQQVAARIIFQHAGHPLAPTLKQGGRIAHFMERAYTLTFMTMNFLDQQHLIKGFVEPARAYFSEHDVPVGGGDLTWPACLPSLKRDRIISAHRELAARYAKMRGLHRATKDIHFSIARTKEKLLDAIVLKGTNCWRTFTMAEAREIIFADLFLNDFFCMGDTCNRQCEGATIGGYLSAQNADITLMAAEADVPWGSTLPLRVKIARFRDNIIFSCPLPEEFWARQLTLCLQDLYDMTLDVEQLGRSFTFLEVQVECVGCEIQYGLKKKVLRGQMTTQPEIKRYPHQKGAMASHTVRGMAHALALKSLHVASSPVWTQSNFAHAYWELSLLYLTSWWEDLLRRQYRKSSGTIPWSDVKAHLNWQTTVPPQTVLLDATTPLPVISLRTFDVRSLRAYMHGQLPLIALKMKRYPEPMARGPEACEPSHPCGSR